MSWKISERLYKDTRGEKDRKLEFRCDTASRDTVIFTTLPL